MFNKNSFTYRQKNYALILIALLLFWASYKRSFSLTVNAKKELVELDNKLAGATDSYKEIEYIKEEVNSLTNIIGTESVRSDVIQQSILEQVTRLSDSLGLKVESIDQIHSFKSSDYIIFSNLLVLEGDFNTLFKALNYLEREFKGSRICSLEYYTKKNLQLKKSKLYARVIFQNYSRN